MDGITRLTSRQTAVGRQKRINYCPLTVSFPAPEPSVSPLRSGRDPLQYSISCAPSASWTAHPRAEVQLLSFDCPLEFRGMRIATSEKRSSNRRGLIAEILTDISACF